MQPIHFPAPAKLAPYISFYGILSVEEGFLEPYVAPPLGLCGMMLVLEGSSNAMVRDKKLLQSDFCATGHLTEPVSGEIIGPYLCLVVFLQPCGLYQLFGIEMSELTNTSMSLEEFLEPEEAHNLIDNLKKAPDHASMIDIMNEFFLAQEPIEISPKVKHAIDYIHQHKGNVTVKDIERNCFITPRSLERHFKVYIGLSPRDYAKIYRFKCLMNFIREKPGLTWGKLCEENGFYDQSHLTRYFTRFLKIKPNELVTADMELVHYLLQD